VNADGNQVTEKEAVVDSVQHMQHKAKRIKQWMSREGLEGERKWMSDTESVAGECLLSPFCQDTQHGRELRERVIGGDATAAGKAVPEVFTSVLQEAAMKAGLAGAIRGFCG
jgi:hypothetical protein